MKTHTKFGFNLLSGAYDRLSRLVFGDKLLKIQRQLLSATSMTEKRVLVVGGGRGEAFCDIDFTSAVVDWIDISGGMLKEAGKRVGSINFIEADFAALETTENYECICCFFFLDMFCGAELKGLCSKLEGMLLPGGELHYADFGRPVNWRQRALLWTMYRFFRLLCGIQARDLEKPPLKLKAKKHFRLMDGFIRGAIYKKPELTTCSKKVLNQSAALSLANSAHDNRALGKSC